MIIFRHLSFFIFYFQVLAFNLKVLALSKTTDDLLWPASNVLGILFDTVCIEQDGGLDSGRRAAGFSFVRSGGVIKLSDGQSLHLSLTLTDGDQ